MTRREETALPRLPSRYRGAKAGADGGEVTPRHMVGVAGKIFRREFPVTRDDPLMHPTHDLNAALTTVEERVQVPRHLPEIVQQRGRHRVKGRKEQALVTVELGDRDEAPLCPVQLLIIGLLEIGHTLEASIVAIGPAMIRAGEAGRIAAIGPA